MPAYEYVALNAKGKEKKGVLEGDSERQIRQQLRQQELIPMQVAQVGKSSDAAVNQISSSKGKSRSGMSVSDLSLFSRQIATLLRVGTPIDEALSTITKHTQSNKVKRIVMGVRAKVVEGYTLAEGLNLFPNAFSSLYRSSVAAGEQSGHLDEILEQLADYTENGHVLKQKISSALIYPILLIVFSLGIVVFLLTFVTPKIITVFENTGQELPFLTKIMIFLSDWIIKYGFYALGAIAIVIVAYLVMARRKAFRRKVDLLKLKVPIFGGLIRNQNTASFTRTLGILASSGVPILKAMKTAGDVVTNIPMQEAVEVAGERVREGTGISSALQKSKLFPPMAMHLISSGEASGNLQGMLEKASEQQEREALTTVTRAMSLLSPAMVLIMATIVLVIVLATLLPILSFDPT